MNITYQLDLIEFYVNDLLPFNENVNFIYNLSTNSNESSFDYVDSETGEVLSIEYQLISGDSYSKGYIFNYIDNISNKSIKLCSYFIGGKKGNVTSKCKFTIYSQFITFFGNDFISDFIKYIFKSDSYIGELRRIDIACDIPENKTKIKKTFINKATSNLNYNKEKDEYETYYFGFRKYKKLLLRIYDKILDTFKKNKSHLYNFESDDLTRIELEFGNIEISSINKTNNNILNLYNILSDKELIKNIFLSRISIFTTFFKDKNFKKYEFKYIYPKRLNLEKYYLKHKQLPKWYRYNAKGLIKKIINLIGIKGFIEFIELESDDLKVMYDVVNYELKNNAKIVINNKFKIINQKLKNQKALKDMYFENKEFLNNLTNLLLCDDIVIASENKFIIETALKKQKII